MSSGFSVQSMIWTLLITWGKSLLSEFFFISVFYLLALKLFNSNVASSYILLVEIYPSGGGTLYQRGHYQDQTATSAEGMKQG